MLLPIVLGLALGGTYALLSLGLTLQYGVSRILNLAYGEVMIAASFVVVLATTRLSIDPLLGLLLVVPLGYGASWLLYTVMMRPLVKRSGGGGRLEVDTILATFGLLFLIEGVLLLGFGANFTSLSYLDTGVSIFGISVALNRVVGFSIAMVAGVGLAVLMATTRWGMRMRAVALAPGSAPLVGIDVSRVARTAFALGGALAAAGGAVVAMVQTFSVADGVVFTMKALVVVIMGGVGNVPGALLAGLFLGLVETFVAVYIDPGLTLAATYVIFLGVLLWRPTGLFGRAA